MNQNSSFCNNIIVSHVYNPSLARDQALLHLSKFYTQGNRFWLKIGQYEFYECHFLGDDIEARYTYLAKKEDSHSRVVNIGKILNLASLLHRATIKPGGMFFMPGNAQELPLKEFCFSSKGLGVEIDEGTKEEQESDYTWFEQVSGLNLLQLTSGGKSIHGHIVCNQHIEIEERTNLARILSVCLLGDPAVTRPAQFMRLAGALRLEKNAPQSLIKPGGVFDLDSIKEGLRRVFSDLNYNWHDALSDKRWQALQQILRKSTHNPLTTEEKRHQLKAILDQDESSFYQAPPVKVNFSQLNLSVDRERVKDDLLRYTDPQAVFAFPSMTSRNSRQLQGYCPIHHGDHSDTMFARIGDDGLWRATCASCGAHGMNFITYLGWRKTGSTHLSKEGYQEALAELASIAGVELPRYNSQDIRKIHTEKAKVTTQKSKNFSPTSTLTTRYLPPQSFKKNTIHLVRSGMGTGKSSSSFTGLMDYILAGDIVPHILTIGLRNNLLHQTKHKLFTALQHALGGSNSSLKKFLKEEKFYHIHDRDVVDVSRQKWLLMCIDSLMKIDPDQVESPIILLDEIESLLHYIYHSHTHIKHSRTAIIERFITLLNKAELIIGLDGNLSDSTATWFSHFVTGKEIIKIENLHKQEWKNPVKVLTGTRFSLTEKINKNDRRPLIKEIFELAQYNAQAIATAGELRPFVIATESQTIGESLEKIFKDVFNLNGFRLDSKTSKTEQAQEFLVNPDSFIAFYKPVFLIYSPSAESGLDVAIKKYFYQLFGFYFGVNTVNLVNSILQMNARIRDDIPSSVWIAPKAVSVNRVKRNTSSLFEYQSILEREFAFSCKQILAGGGEDVDVDMLALIKAYKNQQDFHFNFATEQSRLGVIEQANLRELVIIALQNSGRDIVEWVSDNEEFTTSQDAFKRAKTTRNLEDAQAVFNASEPFFDAIKGRYESRSDDWSDKTKAVIYNIFPGLQNSDLWSVELVNLIRNQSPSLATTLTRELKLRQNVLNIQSSSINYRRLARNEHKSLWNFQDEVGLIATLGQVGILALIDSDNWFFPGGTITLNDGSVVTDLIAPIIKACRASAPRHYLGNQGQMSNIDWLRRILKLLGFTLKTKKARVQGALRTASPVTIFKIERTQIKDFNTSSVIRELQRCLQQKLEIRAKNAQEIPWGKEEIVQVEIDQKAQKMNFHLEEVQTQAEQSFRCVPENLDLFNKKTFLRTHSNDVFKPNDEYNQEALTEVTPSPTVESIQEGFIETEQPKIQPTTEQVGVIFHRYLEIHKIANFIRDLLNRSRVTKVLDEVLSNFFDDEISGAQIIEIINSM